MIVELHAVWVCASTQHIKLNRLVPIPKANCGKLAKATVGKNLANTCGW
jgi:hypothetical protein